LREHGFCRIFTKLRGSCTSRKNHIIQTINLPG
jgi:hypothetical protein